MLAFGEESVKKRVKSIINYKKPTFWLTIVAIVVCISVAVCLLTNREKAVSESYTDYEGVFLSIKSIGTDENGCNILNFGRHI